VEQIRRIYEGGPSEFNLGESGSLWFQKRICVPDITEIKEVILREAHQTPYSIHPGSTKMYMDLQEFAMEIIILAAWGIWISRNNKMFHNQTPSFASWKAIFIQEAKLLTYRMKKKHENSFKEWLQSFF
jgi:hypothetical protein